MRNVALMGLAGAGKDSVAAHLVAKHGYTRVAHADPIREQALFINPYVHAQDDSGTWGYERLTDVVPFYGWDTAKNRFPEVRRILDRLGRAPLDDDPHHWIRKAQRAADASSGPVVITDVRFPDEVTYWRTAGYTLVWVNRPGLARLDLPSENLVTAADADHILHNGSTLGALFRVADDLV